MLNPLFRNRLLGLGLGLALLAGCTSVDLSEPTDDTNGDQSAQQTDGFDQDQNGQQFDNSTEVTPFDASANQADPLEDPNSPLSQRNIYFEFDSFVILPDYQPIIEAHAAYLAGNRNKQIVIEGNTDELGSREYNLALGQKRADAVRRALASQGVDDSQMESISFGEEKPKATGHDEASYAQNRRADLNYR
ncbi:MAG: peptidoglycan-associated lipoprotein Pal [Lautropia sp.]|nr:peptidoglycan-associated lipoprotein Pal [Lautropia sp.]